MASVGRSRAGCATARGSPKPREHTFKNQSPSGKAWVHSIPVSAQIMPSCSWSSLGAAPGAEHSGDTGCVFWDQGNGAQAHPHCSLKSPGKDNPPSAPAANHRHAAEAHPWASPTAREKAPSQCLQAGHTPFTSDSCCHYEPGRINQHSSAKQHKHRAAALCLSHPRALQTIPPATMEKMLLGWSRAADKPPGSTGRKTGADTFAG